MKVISLEEFMANPSPAIYANWPETVSDEVIDIQLPELAIKMEQTFDNWWWELTPWATGLDSLTGAGYYADNGIVKVLEFMDNPIGSLAFDPAMTRGDRTITNDRVLVFEDKDIEHLLGILISTFPEHAKRVYKTQLGESDE